ncbi:CheR family methyltransferase [Gluconacetobacter asukensis]|uniref:Chemotaxis protein methyltransferase n=1 Tax=Gluconacetobacter asukensis TaxID=1017181 RepID=A0A7W4NZ09_9PROT|nr:CheR family methyltransferase [Gluconacetobacter asukensis]MBB2171402.1 chemotaxis protein [Gluconacetobacter asukensis]
MKDLMPASESEYTDADFQRVRQIAREQAGIHLPTTKKALVYSRVSRRVRERGQGSFHAYLDFVTSSAGEGEMQNLIFALTTNVTSFFREKNHFDHLESVVIPHLAPQVRAGRRGRVWSAACSTGQEPWSIAMSVMTAFPDAVSHDFRILATDINANVVAQATEGAYNAEEVEAIPAGRKSQFMEPSDDGDYRFAGPIRRLPAFRVLNLNASWPIQGFFSAIFCRNVVIYFDDATRERLWQRLADKLEPGGFLYVGHSERVSCASACGLIQVAPTIYRKDH